MDKLTGNKHRWTRVVLPILFLIGLTFWFQGIRLNGKIKTLKSEILSTEASTAEIQQTLPALLHVSEQVLGRVVPNLVPRENTADWCEYLINFPRLNKSFKCSHRIREPKIPIQMELPRELRDAGEHLHPAIIPFQIEVSVAGTLSQISYFINEIERQDRSMIVSKIDLRPAGGTDTFKGGLTLTFPQIQFLEDIEEISRFVEKGPMQAFDQADLN